jgi:hypothetical protein
VKTDRNVGKSETVPCVYRNAFIKIIRVSA